MTRQFWSGCGGQPIAPSRFRVIGRDMRRLRFARQWIAALVLLALSAHLGAAVRLADRADPTPRAAGTGVLYVDALLGPTVLCAAGSHRAPSDERSTASESCLFCQRLVDLASAPPALGQARLPAASFVTPASRPTGVSTLAIHLERGAVRGRAPPVRPTA